MGRLTPGGNVNPLASKIWTVSRPGLRVESEVGFSLEVEPMKVEDLSANVLFGGGAVIVPLDCFVEVKGEEDPNVVSFSSTQGGSAFL